MTTKRTTFPTEIKVLMNHIYELHKGVVRRYGDSVMCAILKNEDFSEKEGRISYYLRIFAAGFSHEASW